MPRLRNRVTGAVMSVPESTAARLGIEWVPADEPHETEPDTSTDAVEPEEVASVTGEDEPVGPEEVEEVTAVKRRKAGTTK